MTFETLKRWKVEELKLGFIGKLWNWETLNLRLKSWNLKILDFGKPETLKGRNGEIKNLRNEDTKKRINEEMQKGRNGETKKRRNKEMKK